MSKIFKNPTDLKMRALPHYQRANRLSLGTLDIIRITIKNFSLSRGAEAAASLSYYAIFSLFPLLLVMVSVAGFLINSEQAYQAVLDAIGSILPSAVDLIERNMQVILRQRGTIGIIGLVGAIWSASAFFNTLVRNINRAWLGLKPRGVIRTRLIALAMVALLPILLVLSLTSSTVIDLIRFSESDLLGFIKLNEDQISVYVRLFVPSLFTFFMFLIAYRVIPNTSVSIRAGLWGALYTTVFWELAKRAFSYVLASGLVRYELLYGSLGTVVALMFWIYLSCTIVLLGAHLTATIDQRTRRRNKA